MGKIISIISVIAAILTIITVSIEAPNIVAKISSYLCSAQCNELNKENETLKQQIYDLTTPSIARAKKKCESLAKAKAFEFYQNTQYSFASKNFTKDYGLRAIATHGNWNDLTCKPNGDSGYILEGIDTSVHRIERISIGEDNKLFIEDIATAKAKYRTHLFINKDESFHVRKIISEIGMVPTYEKPEYQKELYHLMCRYDDYRIVKHFNHPDIKKYEGDSKTQPCIPAEGEAQEGILLAFACDNYTRSMVQNVATTKEDLKEFKSQVRQYRNELALLIQDNLEMKKLCKRSMGEHENSE